MVRSSIASAVLDRLLIQVSAFIRAMFMLVLCTWAGAAAAAPTVSWTGPGNVTYSAYRTATVNVLITGTARDSRNQIQQVDILDNFDVIHSVEGGNVAVTLPLTLGSHRVQLNAISASGEEALSTPMTIVVVAATNEPPVVTLLSPANGTNFVTAAGTNASVNISGSGSYYYGNVNRIEVLDYGNVISTIWSNSVNVALPLPIGAHSIQLRAFSDSGVAGISAAAAVTVLAANIAPTASISQPANGAVFQAVGGIASVGVVGGGSDPDGIVSRLELLDGGVYLADLASGSVNVMLGVGIHHLQVRATDNSGATGLSAVSTVVVNAPPLASISAPSAGASYNTPTGTSAAVNVIGGGSDQDGSVVLVEVLDDGAVIARANAAAINVGVLLAIGSHNLQLRVTDNTGATAVSDVRSVVVKALDMPNLTPVTITPPHLENADAGSLPGSLGVSNSGAASYTIDLVVPPGTNGMQPAVSLSYSGQGQNGLLGLGWSINGLSSITRCGKTIAQDGVNGRVSFDHSDRLCLDGQRLILVNRPVTDDNYWAPGAEYRTEIESFARISAESNGPGGALSFRVESRNGRISTYGMVASSSVRAIVGTVNSGTTAPQPLAKSGPQSWAVDRIVDRIGNFIAFSYDQDDVSGEHRIAYIRYGGVGLPAHGAVQFVYEARQDAWKRYIDETRNDVRSRVAHIKTYVGDNLDGANASNGVLVRDYTLTYEQSSTSGRSLLTSVGVCARHPDTGTSDCLPSTVFGWGKPAKSPGFISRGIWSGAPILTTYGLKGPDGNFPRAVHHADYFSFSDFNHDGYTDVLEKRVASMRPSDLDTWDGDVRESTNPVRPGTMQTQYRYFHNTGSSFALYTYRISTGEPFVVLDVGDFDGDGVLDLVVFSSGTKICLSPLGAPGALGAPGSTITFSCRPNLPTAWRNAPGGRSYVFDPRGDGRSAVYSTISIDRKAVFCTLEACQTDTAPPYTLGRDEFSPVDPYNGLPNFATIQNSSYVQMVDFTGNGKPADARWSEIYFQEYYYDGTEKIISNILMNTTPQITMTSLNMPGVKTIEMATYTYPEFNYFFDKPYQGNGLSADFNGSGYNGLAFGMLDIGRNGSASFLSRAETTLCLSTGRALDCGVRRKYSGSDYRTVSAVGNFVGDGAPAILVQPLKSNGPNYVPSASGAIEMCRVLGDDTTAGTGTADANMVCTPWPGLTLPEDLGTVAVDKVHFMDLLGTGRPQLMYYHSGKIINSTWQEDGRWEIFEAIDVAADGQALDRIVSVKNGVGAIASVEYVDALTSGVVSNTGITRNYPQQASSLPGKVVRRLITSNGVGDNQRMTYQYSDAVIDVNGRGSQGFRSVVTTDEQTGRITSTTYSQEWQTAGMPLLSSTVLDGCEILQSASTVTNREILQANGAKSYFPVVEQNRSTKSDLNCAALGTTTVSRQYGDGWGNLTQEDVISVGGGETFISTTISAFRNDVSRWLIGLPTRTIVKKITPTLPSQEVRTTSAEYDEVTGLRIKDVIEPDDNRYRLATEYSRTGNPFGLVSKATQQWLSTAGVAQARVLSDTVHDARGRFPGIIKNALGHTQALDYYPETGVRKSLTDPNGLTTTWSADGFGRVRVERQANGNEMRNYLKQCVGDCPSGAAVAQISENFHGNARIAVPTVVYSDSAGHVVRTLTWGVGGGAILADQRYDARGRLSATDWPRFEQNPSYQQSALAYDALDRVTTTTTLDDAGATHESRTQPSGYVTTITNVLGQTRVETRNVLGQIKSVADAKQQITQFEYEAFGALSKTIDPNGNVITVAYDRLGRKTHLYDPDLGHIEYVVDAPGRIIGQVSPTQRTRGQITTFLFDDLDRMIKRAEPDLESHWNFDTATKGVGQLAQAYTQTGSVVDYQRVHSYDAFGRPAMTTQHLTDGTYKSAAEYDDWGRLLRQSYQRNADAMKTFDFRYSGTGDLVRVLRSNLALWILDEQDALRHATRVILGNGLTHVQSFNPYTSRLRNAVVTTASGTARLQEGYDYDLIGSVVNRTQYWDAGGFQEGFHYDALNRLDTSTVLGQAPQSYTYDNVGNLTSKSGVGFYVYPVQGAGAIRPHAVQSTDSTGTFTYDDNGNLLTGAGRSISWTSFDMPSNINGVGASATFVYGPEHQRTRQDRNDGSVVVYAGAQEVESKAGQVTVKTYWPLGIGVEIDRPNAAGSELNWTHVDRLGSPVALTDANGVVREKLAYDAWGKRRTLDGSATPNNLDGQVDNRGFTGHEMLDQLDLVHMNGRVYDPLIARFVSGDPLVSDPMNGQGYNRYTYVLNNPTNLRDPTGFSEIDPNAIRTGSHIPGVPTGARCMQECTIKETPAKDQAETIKPNGKVDPATRTSANRDKPLQAAGCGQCNRFPDRPTESPPEQPGIVERHVDRSLCAHRACTPWEQAQSAFLGMTSMVAEAGAKFTMAVASVLPFGRAATVEVGAAEALGKAAPKVLQTTAHGAERLAGAGATRGGVLSAESAQAVIQNGRVLTQADGAAVHVMQNTQSRFSVVVSGERGIITTFENISQKSFDRLSKNYGWH